MITLGFRPKTGWTTVILLGGSPRAPTLLDSRTLELCDPEEEHSRQPYHATFGVAQRDQAIIARLVKGVERIARSAITAVLREYDKQGHRPTRAAVIVSSLADPRSIANQHMRAHASEGLLYRRVVMESLDLKGLTAAVALEREVYALLAKAIRRTPAAAQSAVQALGIAAARWRAEEKTAAAGAWLAQSRRV
jgi:hypothetical protein